MKLKHYSTVIHPETLYAMESLSLNQKSLVEKIEIRKKRHFRKILGLDLENGKYQRRLHNSDFFPIEKDLLIVLRREDSLNLHLERDDLTELPPPNHRLSFSVLTVDYLLL